MNTAYVWRTIFNTPYGICSEEIEERKLNICEWISVAYKNGDFSRNVVGNLMLRMRKDFEDEKTWEYFEFILKSDNFEDFLLNVPEYMKCRMTFPSRDKLPVDPLSLPLSNEKMYGKGINSRVRD